MIVGSPFLETLYESCLADDASGIVRSVEEHMNFHFANRLATRELFYAMDAIQEQALRYLENRGVIAKSVSSARSAYERCKYKMRRRPGDTL